MHGCAPRAGGVRSGGGCDCRPVSFWWRRPRNLERSHDVAGPAADPSESLVISVSLRHPGHPHCHASGTVVENSVRRPPLRTGRGQASLGMPQRGGSAKRGPQRDLASFLTLIGKTLAVARPVALGFRNMGSGALLLSLSAAGVATESATTDAQLPRAPSFATPLQLVDVS